MSFRFVRGALLASALSGAMSYSEFARAATFTEFVDPHPAPGNLFGQLVVPLSTGNVVITSPFDDVGGTDAGAVYLFNGATGALISTLRGSTAGDYVGISGVMVLGNGNFVVLSPAWQNGPAVNAGAATWGSGTTGVSGVVSSANSLVGSTANDQVGLNGGVIALSNGNYVVWTFTWDNGAVADAGAATWGSGTTGVSGVISAANSLIGSTTNDHVGGNVMPLSNGNYVVLSSEWDNGAVVNVGAATWASGTTGLSGVVSAANSLVGSTAGDRVGVRATALANGNYVVESPVWDNGAIVDAGAATWGSGTSGVSAVVSSANSLVGSTANDLVGNGDATALSNGNYVVVSPSWDNGAVVNAGAVTWGSGVGGVSGVITPANSLVGSTAGDQVGIQPAPIALPNGNYVVVSALWDNGAVVNAGAVTWGSGTGGVSGVVSAANSLVGSTTEDEVGGTSLTGGVTVLSNSSYVVRTPFWDSGAVANAGAVTWGSGTGGVSGVISAGNSLVGSTTEDRVGNTGVTALSNGNYVVHSPVWDNGAVVDAGAATWGNGTSGVIGVVSSANSLVGSTASDLVGLDATALSNGNYVVRNSSWDNGPVVDAGAVTWGNGTTGVSGVISAGNSLVGSVAGDGIGSVTALTNGNYVVASSSWHNGAVAGAGAVTWGSGTTGVSGVISAGNSLVGSVAGDGVGSSVTALSNGDFAVVSPYWDNGLAVNGGAATRGSGTAGVSGPVTPSNSLVGAVPNTGLSDVVEDVVNGTLLARFLTDGGGRVRIVPDDPSPVITSAVDIPNDQGGWLRLTFNRSVLDQIDVSPPIAMYGVWRHVPGTLPAALRGPASGSVASTHNTEQLQALLPVGLGAREVGGQLYVSTHTASPPENAATFPPGTWALLTSVPAVQLPQYVVDVPTISNASPNDYVVTAHTTTPTVWYISDVISGQSVDNLAPAQPAAFTASFAAGQTHLQWAANTEHDLGSYHLYRGASTGFIPAPGNQIASQISTSYSDPGPSGGYYKLSAVDVNGNESGFALVTPGQTLGVDGNSPVAFALDGPRPDPAVGNALSVAFALPSGAPAKLQLLDVGGRRVREQEVGSLGPGRHTVNLAEGHPVASGIYWLALEQGVNHKRVRVVVLQ